jgi:hypothetical protein
MPSRNSETLGFGAIKWRMKALIGIVRVDTMAATRHRRGIAIVACARIILPVSQQSLRNQEPEIMTLREPGTLQSLLQVL